jgi:spermidine synthase
VTISLLTIGFISILGQVVLLRELSVASFGIELVYLLAMGVWLLGTALGASFGRRSFTPPAGAVRHLLFLFAALLPLEVVFVRGSRVLFGGIPGGYLPFTTQLLIIWLALLPIGVLLGLLFQWAAKLYIGRRRSLALAYGIESAGGLFGGGASTLLLAAGIQNLSAALLCSLLTVAAALFVRGSRSGPARLVGTVLGLLLAVGLVYSNRIDFQLTRWDHPSLVDTRDSPYSRITITGRQGQVVVFENDVLGSETESVAAEELVHLSAIHRENLRDALILGGGVDGLVREMQKHRPNRIDYVELNAVLLQLARRHLPAGAWMLPDSQSVTIHIEDPRAYLAGSGRYDLILVGMPDPSSGQANRFFTTEFFEACSNRLKPGGVMAFRLSSAENVWTRFLTLRNSSIYRSLASVFEDVIVLPGVTNIYIASLDSLSRDPDSLSRRFLQRNITTRLINPAYINYLYTNDRFFEIAGRLAASNAPANTDTRPICYRVSSLIWLSKFFPGLINWEGPADLGRTGIFKFLLPAAAGLAGLFLLARRKPGRRRILLVGSAGFLGMVFETGLILYYQVKKGVLYQNLGLLLMLFMAGLAAGSMVIVKMAGRDEPAYGRNPMIGAGLMGGFAVLNLIYIGFLSLDYPAGIPFTGCLIFLTGFLVAGVFAWASLSGAGRQQDLVSPLYAADLLGGCFGSLLGSLLLIPFWGLIPTGVALAVLSLMGILLV